MITKDTASLGSWPADDLEWLGQCPGCGSSHRAILYDSIGDFAFGFAPGDWKMWQCRDCMAGYIDPRPSKDSIGRAYGNYYTHDPIDRNSIDSLLSGTNINTRLRTGYYNRKYGYHFKNGAEIGFLAAMIAPRKRTQWDHVIRHLPPPSEHGATLLDIGCGAGAFLQTARGLGYSPIGLEPDAVAAASAQSSNLDVRIGQLPNTGFLTETFEHVTLSHVFEHLHRPNEAVEELFRLLKPGGRIWFSQPNLDADGHREFGKFWRGLEIPRHLYLLNVSGFVKFLHKHGFQDVELLPPRPEAAAYFKTSLSMAEGVIPRPHIIPEGWDARWESRARKADRVAARRPERGESLTIIARKPSR